MTNLVNQNPNVIYGDLLTTTNQGQGLDAVLRQVQDGKGDASTMLISTGGVNFLRGGAQGFQLDGIQLTATSTLINSLCNQNPAFISVSAVSIPSGTTAQRPNVPQEGDFRYNTDTQRFEGYGGAFPAWIDITP